MENTIDCQYIILKPSKVICTLYISRFNFVYSYLILKRGNNATIKLKSMRIFIQWNVSLLTGNKVTNCRLFFFITQIVKTFLCFIKYNTGKKCKKSTSIFLKLTCLLYFFGANFSAKMVKTLTNCWRHCWCRYFIDWQWP